jgi:hypothetical protein
MTAHQLIDSIFSRPQMWLPGNMRRITRAQLDFLVNLIDEDEEGGAVEKGSGSSLVWMPSGRHKYVITEDASGGKHTLTRMSNLVASSAGRLF